MALQLEKELFLYDNDVYVLGLTKEYIVVNHNYKGIKYYDHNLRFLKQLSFQDEIIIYQLYASLNDNNIVILDVENEKMHIIKLDGRNDDIISIVQKEIFKNYFYSYDDYFELKKQGIVYKFSYYNGLLLEKRDSIYGNILDNNQDEFIYCIENRIIYHKG